MDDEEISEGEKRMIVAVDKRMTLQEFLEFDDGSDRQYELVDGALVEMGAESTGNLRIAMYLIDYFLKIVGFDRVGIKEKIQVKSSFWTARDADLIIHSESSSLALDGRSEACLFLEDPNPLAVIEIVSPGTQSKPNYKRDYAQKPGEYAGRGIPEMWQVDAVREWVRVGSLVDGEYEFKTYMADDRIVSLMFPDLDLTVAQILGAGKRAMKKS